MRKVATMKLMKASHLLLKEKYKAAYGTEIGEVRHIFGCYGDISVHAGTIEAIMFNEQEFALLDKAIKECVKEFKWES